MRFGINRGFKPRRTATRNQLCTNWRGASNIVILANSELTDNKLLTIQEVAEWAKVSTKTVYRWISDNKMTGIRLGNRTYRIPASKSDLSI